MKTKRTKSAPQPAASPAGNATTDGKKLIAAHLRVKTAMVDAFVDMARPIIAASRAEPGCISYTLLQDPYDQTAFCFLEEWRSQQAIDEHFATPHFTLFGAQLHELLADAPAITIYACSGEQKAGG